MVVVQVQYELNFWTPIVSRPKIVIRNLHYLKHLCSDSGADRTYHARDTAGRAHMVSGSRFSKMQCLGLPNFPYTLSPARSPFRGLRWITGRKKGLKRLAISILCSFRSSSFAVYARSNRPVKLRSLPASRPAYRRTIKFCRLLLPK